MTTLVSQPATGVTDPNPDDASFEGASADGSRVFFETPEKLTAGDTDANRYDVYERAGGVTTLVSQPPTGVTDPDTHGVSFQGASADGSRVFFETQQKLTAGDTDSDLEDVYERAGGVTTLVSQPATGVADPDPDRVEFMGTSADGSRVFFTTTEKLTADDTDTDRTDVYERAGGMTTLVSQPTTNVTDPDTGDPVFRGASAGGNRVFFETAQPMTADDNDSARTDVYAAGSPDPRPNAAPAAGDDAYTTAEDTPLNVPASGVLANDTDPDGDPLTAAPGSGPAHGTLTLNADGSFTYTPATDYNGSDSFTYSAGDGSLDKTATVSLTVSAVNDAPACADLTAAADEDAPLAAAPDCSDVDNDALSYAIVDPPAHGSASVVSGLLRYTPAADYNGPDSFTYKAGDGSLDSNNATVSIDVAAVNEAPTAASDAHVTDEDTPLTVDAPGVLGNDTDPDGDTLTAVLVSGPAHGSLELNPDGSFSYTPARDFNGSDSFSYRAGDGSLESDPVTVTIDVSAVDDTPAAGAAQPPAGAPRPRGLPRRPVPQPPRSRRWPGLCSARAVCGARARGGCG